MLLRSFEPYKPKRGEEYMNEKQREHFKALLLDWKQDLMAEGVAAEEIMSMCDLHSQVTRDVLVQLPPKPVPPPPAPVAVAKSAAQTASSDSKAAADALEVARSLADGGKLESIMVCRPSIVGLPPRRRKRRDHRTMVEWG